MLNRTLFYLIRVHLISWLQRPKLPLSKRRRAHEGAYNTFTCECDVRVLTIRLRIRMRWSIRLTTATRFLGPRTPFNYPPCLCTSNGNIAPGIAQFVLTRILNVESVTCRRMKFVELLRTLRTLTRISSTIFVNSFYLWERDCSRNYSCVVNS